MFVPSGEQTFKIDMVSRKVEVQHASRWYQNPHWTGEYKMVKLEKHYMEMAHSHNVFDDTLYYHISQFKPEFY